MKTLTKQCQNDITPSLAITILKNGNKRFVENTKFNRNFLDQIDQTSDAQHPFATIISCMDSRSSAELIFDQGIGDIFSIRIAGNVVNEDILGSAEYGSKVVGSKIILVLGHTKCGAVNGAIANVELGHLHSVTSKIQRCHALTNEATRKSGSELENLVARENVKLGINDIRIRSSILREMEDNKEIIICGGIYDVSTGLVDFFDLNESIDASKSFIRKKNDNSLTGEMQ